MSVDRRLTLSELETGALRLGPTEAVELGMPEFSQQVGVRYQGRDSHAHWDARRRTITGEELMEDLALEAQDGDVIRWSVDGGSLVVETTKAWSSGRSIQSVGFFDTDPFADDLGGPSLFSTRSTNKPRKRRAARSTQRAHVEGDFDWPRRSIGILRSSLTEIAEGIQGGGWDDPEDFQLRLRGEELSAVNDFDELVAADSARIDPMEHQYATALKALGVMRGRAILADEVGLGKTIEAGLIASELRVRGLADRLLIICPAPLRDQWREELREKFNIDATVILTGSDPLHRGSLIMSLQMARNQMDTLHAMEWGLVIVDEAHKLSGAGATKTHDLIRGLTTRYMLFLTATPVQNDLRELYRLVELLRPGTFLSQRDFERRYISSDDPRQPRNPADLRNLVSHVMIRTTRAQAGLDTVRRFPQDIRIEMADDERAAYDLTLRILRDVLTGTGDRLRRETLARALTLSPRGLYESARKVAERHPDPKAQQVLRDLADVAIDRGPTSRQLRLLELVQQWLSDADKGRVIVFTQHTRVLSDLIQVLDSAGIEAAPYHGGMSASAKSQALERFRGATKVLLSTESGAEGLNLQHANAVINYDLPWNPMRIEQRIGRVHRVTQTRDVHVANMFAAGTIDEHVYDILVSKLKMFELLFGQITTILGEMEEASHKGHTFEGQIRDALFSRSNTEMKKRLDEIAQRANAASVRAEAQLVDGGGVSAWMSPSLDHRANIRTEATELKPATAARTRARQQAVEAFARDWMIAHGSEILHETSTFVAIQLNDYLHERMGSDTLYLAFSPEALREHPGAELVAVGSPLFLDIIDATREAGDLLAWTINVPDLNDLALFPPLPSMDGTARVERQVAAPTAVGGTATWRISDENTRLSDEVRQVSWGDPTIDAAAHVPVQDGIPTTAVRSLLGGTPKDFVSRVTRQSLTGIAAVQSDWQEDVRTVFAEDRDRRMSTVNEELRSYDEHYWPGPQRVEIEQRIEQIKAEKPPSIRVHAQLLAVEIVSGSTVAVTDTWRRDDGVAATVQGVWDAKTSTLSFTGADGGPITIVGLCDAGHAVNQTTLTTCPQCRTNACFVCAADLRPSHGCEICDRAVCRTCLPAGRACIVCGRGACAGCWDEGVCITCAAPHDLTEADVAALAPTFLHLTGMAVRYGFDDHQSVFSAAGGQRKEVAVIDTDGSLLNWWTLSELDEDLLAEAVDVARHAGVSGAIDVDFDDQRTPPRPDPAGPHALLTTRESVDIEWAVNHRIVQTGAPSGYGPRPPSTMELASALERTIPPLVAPAAATVRKALVHSASCTWVDRLGLNRWTALGSTAHTDTQAWTKPTEETRAWMTWYTEAGEPPAPVQSATLGDITVVIAVDNTRLATYVASRTADHDLVSWPVKKRNDRPAGSISLTGLPGLLAWTIPDLNDADAYPAQAALDGWQLLHRRWDDPIVAQLNVQALGPVPLWSDQSTVRVSLLGQSAPVNGLHLEHVNPSSDLVPTSGRGVIRDITRSLNRLWTRHREPAPQEPPTARLIGLHAEWGGVIDVSEVWQDPYGHHIDVSASWTARDGALTRSSADGSLITVLAACSRSHPTDQTRLAQCPQCLTNACPQCPAEPQPTHECPVCDRSVCAKCLPAQNVCVFCSRQVCSGCWSDNSLCATCSVPLHAAAADLPDGLAKTVLPQGLAIRIGRDAQQTTVALAGGARQELLQLRPDGTIRQWWTFADTEPELLHQALAVTATTDHDGNIAPQTQATPAATPDIDSQRAHVIHSARHTVTSWTVNGESVPEQHLTPSAYRPEPGHSDTRSRAWASICPADTSPAAPVILHTVESYEAIWLDASGLHRWNSEGPGVREENDAWGSPKPSDVALAHHVLTSQPSAPTVNGVSAVGPHRVLIAALGKYRFLVLTDTDAQQTVAWDLDGLQQETMKIAAGLALTGQWIPVEVTGRLPELPQHSPLASRAGMVTTTSRQWLALPDVSGVMAHPDEARPLGQIPPDTSATVLRQDHMVPPNPAIKALADGLDPVIAAHPDHRTRPFLIAVEITYSAGVGNENLAGSYWVLPRDHPNALTVPDTGIAIAQPLLCDHGHIDSTVTTCGYCLRWFCTHCPEVLARCEICDLTMCPTCHPGNSRCLACSNLDRPGWLARRRLTKGVKGVQGVLASVDSVHQVTLLRLPSTVLRIRTMNGAETRDEHHANALLESLFG